MFKELWARIRTKQRTGAKLTRKEQILAELNRDIGTAKQIADRSGVKLSGPQKNFFTPVSSVMGTRLIARST